MRKCTDWDFYLILSDFKASRLLIYVYIIVVHAVSVPPFTCMYTAFVYSFLPMDISVLPHAFSPIWIDERGSLRKHRMSLPNSVEACWPLPVPPQCPQGHGPKEGKRAKVQAVPLRPVNREGGKKSSIGEGEGEGRNIGVWRRSVGEGHALLVPSDTNPLWQPN